MPAPINNKYALKWTEETVHATLSKIEADVLNPDMLYIGSVMVKQSLSRKLWSYWKEVYIDNDEIIERMMRVEAIIEARLFDAALKGEVNGTMAIFALKCNHQWYDRPISEPAAKPLPTRTGMVIRLSDETIVIP